MSEIPKIVEECILPSRGLIYDTAEVNPNVVLSSMKTKHEMLRLSATDDSNKVMAEIIDDCIESDLGISSYDLCLGDFQYLMMKLRVVTFGPDYEVQTRCPLCAFEQPASFNLDELDVHEYADNLEQLMELELPVTGTKLRLGLQTPRILDKITSRCKEYRRRHKDTDENPVVLYTVMSAIIERDGETPNPFELENWVKNLPLADCQAIVNRVEELNDQIGLNLTTETTCKVCGRVYEVPFRITGEFFRPRNIRPQNKAKLDI